MILTTHGFSVNSQLKHLFLQRYERYLPTAFDESMSLLEKMNKLIEAQNKIIDVVNTHTEYTNEQLFKAFGIIDDNLRKQLENFKEVIEENNAELEQLVDYVENSQLPETVEEKLETWLLDGTIINLITTSVFPELVERLKIVENKTNVKTKTVFDYGAVGDGVSDDTEAFKEAGLSGETVSVPHGEFIISAPIRMSSNTQFIGDGEKSKIINGTGGKFVLFLGEGNFGSEHALTQNEDRGSKKVSVGDTSNFSIGDHIRIVSQRDALHREDSGDSWTGVRTGGFQNGVHFGEIKRISNISGSNLEFDGGLIFPDYLTHNNNEKSTYAKNNSTVQKINFTENLKVANMSIQGTFLSAVRYLVCKNSYVENVKWTGAGDGEVLYFSESYLCEGRNVQVEHDTTIPINNYASRNTLKTVSSYMCGFRNCTAINGSQAIDFTYANKEEGTIIDVDSYAIGCKIIGASRHSGTSHGGTYRSVFKDNLMVDCLVDGIMARSPQSIITGNTISGGGETSPSGIRTHGIRLNQGSATNSIISGNTIENFSSGIGTIGTSEYEFEYVGALITDNSITHVNQGMEFRGSNNPRNHKAHIMVSNNHISNLVGVYANFIQIYSYFRDIQILNNNLIGGSNLSAGIRIRENSFDIDIVGNTIIDGSRGLLAEGVNDPIFDGITKRLNFKDNKTSISTTTIKDNIGNLRLDDVLIPQYLLPFNTDSQGIGMSTRRWQSIYLTNSPNVTSDLRLKKDVNSLDNAMDIITQLNPVEYKLKSNNELTYGLIAQEVEKVIEHGVVSKPVSDDDFYGMKYESLIPFLIKAIQELNDKIK